MKADMQESSMGKRDNHNCGSKGAAKVLRCRLERMTSMPGFAHFVAGAARQLSQVGELCRRRDRTVCGQELVWLGRMSVTATVMSSDTAFCTISTTQLSAGSATMPEQIVRPWTAACHGAVSRAPPSQPNSAAHCGCPSLE